MRINFSLDFLRIVRRNSPRAHPVNDMRCWRTVTPDRHHALSGVCLTLRCSDVTCCHRVLQLRGLLRLPPAEQLVVHHPRARGPGRRVSWVGSLLGVLGTGLGVG